MKVVVLLVALVAVASAERVFIERDTSLPLPKEWIQTRRVADLTQRRLLRFAVKIGNPEELERRVWAVSEPDSPEYGQHLNIAQLAEITENIGGLSTVRRFLRRFGVTNTRTALTRDWVSAEVPLVLIEKMFNVTFHTFHHLPTGQMHTATLDAYSLPARVAAEVDLVTMVSGLPDIRVRREARTESHARSGAIIDPSVIRTRYNISEDITCNNANNSHAVAEFQDQNYKPSDLQKFFSKYVPNAPAGSDVVAKVIGDNNENDPGIEASLDIEYMMGIAPNVTTWFYCTADFNFYQDLTNWLNELSSEPAIPFVITVSYGEQGDYPSSSYIQRSEQEYEKVGLRGTTVIFASGDSGAECGDRCEKLYVSYPAESVYVTALGATKFLSGNTGPEGAVSAFKSGGGFSQTIPLPTYQLAVVNTYTAMTTIKFPPPGAWNSSNRANPDFGALGDEEFQVINNGFTITVGGTSASAPTFGAVLTYLNDLRLNANKPTIGFANPVLYQWAQTVPGAFFDVTEGNNYEVLAHALIRRIVNILTAVILQRAARELVDRITNPDLLAHQDTTQSLEWVCQDID